MTKREDEMSERQNGLELVKGAIAYYYGKRCEEDEPGCPCCDAWAWFDAACARSDWQPIETAPTNREVDLWSSKGFRYPNAIIDVVDYGLPLDDPNQYGWTDSSHHGSIEECGPFTHWMPQPEPPEFQGTGKRA